MQCTSTDVVSVLPVRAVHCSEELKAQPNGCRRAIDHSCDSECCTVDFLASLSTGGGRRADLWTLGAFYFLFVTACTSRVVEDATGKGGWPSPTRRWRAYTTARRLDLSPTRKR